MKDKNITRGDFRFLAKFAETYVLMAAALVLGFLAGLAF